MTREALKQFNEEILPKDTFSHLCNISFTKITPEIAEGQMEVKEINLNFQGFIHGGALATFADVTAGSLITGGMGYICVTLNSNVHYFKNTGVGRVTSKAHLISFNHPLAICQVDIFAPDGSLMVQCAMDMYILASKNDQTQKYEEILKK